MQLFNPPASCHSALTEHAPCTPNHATQRAGEIVGAECCTGHIAKAKGVFKDSMLPDCVHCSWGTDWGEEGFARVQMAADGFPGACAMYNFNFIPAPVIGPR